MGTGTAHGSPSPVRSVALVIAGAIAALALRPMFSPAAAAAASSGAAEVCTAQEQRVVQLEATVRRLQQQIGVVQTDVIKNMQRQVGGGCPPCAAAGSSTAVVAASLSSSSSPPPPPHQPWTWTALVMNALRPFERLNGGITLRGLRLAEQKCKISTWCHRAQVSADVRCRRCRLRPMTAASVSTALR